ncbi:sensor histidine kinase [Aliikangiella sp. IMCC44632]
MNNKELFSTILASTVHDMKNSLGMMLESLEIILNQQQQAKSSKDYSVVQYEASRLNSSLVQLLAMYKIGNNQMPFNPAYHDLIDFFEEQVLIHEPLLNAKGFQCELNISENIEAVFDETLLSMVVSNVIGNAIRYAHSSIRISAHIDQGVRISICDDGPGYPGPMLEMEGDYIKGIDRSSGSTGLGLFFAQQVAQLHKHGELTGKIELYNGGELGGGVFEITLP